MKIDLMQVKEAPFELSDELYRSHLPDMYRWYSLDDLVLLGIGIGRTKGMKEQRERDSASRLRQDMGQ